LRVRGEGGQGEQRGSAGPNRGAPREPISHRSLSTNLLCASPQVGRQILTGTAAKTNRFRN
jgi:hypothetical protein